MAYSSVRVQFEIGHEASVRTKKTPEGFTHDWEVFVRGADNTDIQYFVDKVVFHLHETFPKPRRVIKEPPYLVKESGYAGFVLPIDVYLKNKEEPKKISFQYDLQLQPSGPPISRVLREPRLFQNPSEDFRRKLIRGGGVGVDTPSESQHADDLKSLPGAIKGKTIESPIKKHRTDIVNSNDSFAELFGTPIRRSLDPKKVQDVGKKLPDSDFFKNKKKLNKYESYKDEREPGKNRDKSLEKEKNREKERSKEKQNRHPSSPPVVPVFQSLKSKEEHKKHEEKRKEDHEDKKKKKDDRDRKEKVKDVKESSKQAKEKEHKADKKDFKDNLDHVKSGNATKPYEVKGNYERHNADFYEKEKEKHKHRHKKKDKDKNKEREKQKKKDVKDERVDKELKEREKEKEKEKAGKKKHGEGRERDEKTKRKSKSPSPTPERLKKKPLNALLDELGSSDSMSPLSDDDANHPFRSFPKPAARIVAGPKSLAPMLGVNAKTASTNLSCLEPDTKVSEKEFDKGGKPIDGQREAKSLSKKSKKVKEDVEKRKVQTAEGRRLRCPSSEDDEIERSRLGVKDERERIEKERLEEEKSSANKDRENKKRKRDKSDEKQGKTKKSVNLENNGGVAAQPPGLVEFPDGGEDAKRSDRFTKEYVAQLKDLQHRIMSLEDNAELQKVVKVIAETGQYEITKKTFDFDLCALDLDTVKRLQDFFLPT